MNKISLILALSLSAVVFSGGGYFVGSRFVKPSSKSPAQSAVENTISSYVSALSKGDKKSVDTYLGGIAKVNFDKFSGSGLKPTPVRYNIVELHVSGVIATATVELTSSTQDQVQDFTLFRHGGDWKVVDIQYDPWSIGMQTTQRASTATIRLVVADFVETSAQGDIKSALSDLTGEAYNQTAQFAQGKSNQPPVKIGTIRFSNQTSWNSNHAGIEAVYTSTFSGHTVSRDEWFSLVKVGGVWKIEEVIAV